jgi:hypothetical protein
MFEEFVFRYQLPVLELIMKDNHTLGGNPQNLVEWVRIFREEIDRAAG